jgi:hypothetical protein
LNEKKSFPLLENSSGKTCPGLAPSASYQVRGAPIEVIQQYIKEQDSKDDKTKIL